MATGSAEIKSRFLRTPFGSFGLSWYNLWHINEVPADFRGGLGTNWSSDNFAYMKRNRHGELVFIWTPGRGGRVLWFTQNGTSYEAKFGARQTLVEDGDLWRITDPDGTVWEFDAVTERLVKHITPGGQTTEHLWDEMEGRVSETRRTVGSDVESRVFTYNGEGLVIEVTLWRGTSSDPFETSVRRAVLGYYATSESGKGNAGDLKTVTLEAPSGVGGWTSLGTSYFRYYTAESAISFKGGLKYAVFPDGYARLANPDTATDGQVASVASVAYQYDPTSRRITKSATEGGSLEFDIAYVESASMDDYNHWRRKAVMTADDGATKRVYSNHIGQDMLVDLEKGTGRWISYNKYSEDGRIEWRVMPSAIDMSATPYNDVFDNLDVQLKTDAGLIHVRTYYPMTVPPATGAAPGFLKDEKVQKGSNGSVANNGLVTTSTTEYLTRTVGSGPTLARAYFVAKRIAYTSDASGGSGAVATEYDHVFHSGTTQPATVTEILPDISGGQNGGAWLTDNTRIRVLDIQGRLTQGTDARGIETTYEYNDASGSPVEMTQDAGTGGLQLVTNYQSDELGRTTGVLGPAHNVNGQTVRTAKWTVYQDDDHETWTGRGYRMGSGTTGTAWLVNPVSITRRNASGQVTDEIEAVRGSGVENEGALSSSDSFPQTAWTGWTHHAFGDSGRLTAMRAYHAIPTSGPGSSGTNYDETTFGYHAAGWRNMIKSPGGTVTRTIYDARGLVLDTWIGTNDTGATDDNPAGSGSPNNMKAVAKNTYDTNAYGSSDNSLDGLLTKVTRLVDDTSGNDRIAEYRYDWRDRRTTTITTDGTNTFHSTTTYDNQSRLILAEQKRDLGGGNFRLIAKAETSYDTRGLVYQSKRWGVADNGSPTNALTDNSWYDAEGNVLKSLPAGSQVFAKTTYDALSRPTASYQGYYSGTGTETPQSVSTDVIYEQSITTYDEAGNATFSTTKARWHDATGNGALNGPSGSQPKSRDSYSAAWFDGIGRAIAQADYGTNNNSGAPTPPDSAPTSSDTVLVSQVAFNARGELEDQVDPAGKVTRDEYDDAGRVTKTVRNHGSTPTEDVRTTYTPNSQVATLTAVNSTTGNQVTTYAYGVTTSGGSQINTNDLLGTVTYPDSGVATYQYNRQGQPIELIDQNGSVHEYAYDKLDRPTLDKVTTLGTSSGASVDGFVRRFEASYDDRMRLSHATSYSAISNGSVRSDVQYAYNDFNQHVTEYQQHGAAVDTGTSPKVQYAYANGAANTIRRTSCTYPDTRIVNYDYGTSGGTNDKLSRVQKIKIGTTDIVEYEYLGLGQVVIQRYVEPSTDVQYTLATGSGTNPYAGLDRFGRIIDLTWKQP